MRLASFARWGVLLLSGLAVVSVRAMPQQDSKAGAVTFNKQVLPILQKNCQACHRPGEIAPMSFLTYQDVRPWAKAIKTAVVKRQMPPWFADPAYGHFANDKRLTDAEIATLSAWADSGAGEGEAKDKPAPVAFHDGWNIEPDMIIEMPRDFDVPATGTVAYKNILVKVNFAEDAWIVAAEMRPGNPQVLHHGRVLVRPPGSEFMKDAVPGEAYDTTSIGVLGKESPETLGKFNPGLGPQDFDQFESAKFVPKGSDLVFNLHYTAIGKAATDRSRVGLVFAKKSPTLRYVMHNGPAAANLAIPPHDGNAEIVSELTTNVDMKLVYVQPHMHLRGKDYELRLVYPTGKTETVFKAKWDFNWQMGYDLAEPKVLPKGTRMIGVAHFDNSTANKFNPDANTTVHWGDQNWDEMQNCFIGVLIDPKIDAARLFSPSGPSLLPRGASGPTQSALK
ncbi:MAG TPA: cytochrome c [Vicinamibacterales bacterium]|jgi:mono/diheme cytochrome c family protein